jgi:hypothetical protein
VVSFFVTNRQAGQADSNSFHQNLVAQLAALAGVANPGEPLPGARDGQRRRLLAEAAAKVGGRGNRLVLVVDGLDEDRSNLALGQPSIASCLPDRLPAGVRVVVASRWHPDVPTDVDGHHPLRSCRQVRLAASEAAGDVKRLAEQELTARLQGADPVAYQIIAFLVASGGGLTTGELSELIDLPEANPPAVTGKLEGGDFSRSVVARASVEDGDKRYLLAHDTLREMAESQLGGDVDRYRDRLHSWADRYAASGWPESTPRYLFRPYGRMLAARSLTDRLVKLAGDQVRHDRMLEFTMGDGQALAEIDDAQLLLLAGPRYDFIAIADLAVHRFRLTQRNGAIPVFLPSVWAQVGEDTRGEALAGSITEPQMQAVALTQLVLAMVRAGRPPAAARIASDLERLARSITEPVQLAWALTGAAQALALTGSPAAEQAVSDAEQVATGLPDPAQRNWALAWVAQALAVVGGAARAQRIVATLAPADRDGAWLVVAQALAAVGDAGGAEQVAGAIDDPGRRMLALAAAAQTLIDSRDDKAADQAAAMADVARAVVDPQQRQWAERRGRAPDRRSRGGAGSAGPSRVGCDGRVSRRGSGHLGW